MQAPINPSPVEPPETSRVRPAQASIDVTPPAPKPPEMPPPVKELSGEPLVEPPPAKSCRAARDAGVPAARPPAVIPLVHAPDDPGPEIEGVIEPAPDGDAKADVWGRLRQYFKT